MHEVLAVLAACHEAHIYHGDVKPANFMFKGQLDVTQQLHSLERCLLNPDEIFLCPVPLER